MAPELKTRQLNGQMTEKQVISAIMSLLGDDLRDREVEACPEFSIKTEMAVSTWHLKKMIKFSVFWKQKANNK